ncbi:hypothetical protein J4E83_009961 [Alternaria metachromatica]|uniref:uncharacterized protein n=1 Tax=Alternaria metachromatica TaxID=283354 RepID=UPI0020C22C01|nr:uncharacterized protein J4E83_009961 [Alternaria metachromatica]KAI4606589.1 hypothetical protein J4E83_009961 [Alternaria metachromatica]
MVLFRFELAELEWLSHKIDMERKGKVLPDEEGTPSASSSTRPKRRTPTARATDMDREDELPTDDEDVPAASSSAPAKRRTPTTRATDMDREDELPTDDEYLPAASSSAPGKRRIITPRKGRRVPTPTVPTDDEVESSMPVQSSAAGPSSRRRTLASVNTPTPGGSAGKRPAPPEFDSDEVEEVPPPYHSHPGFPKPERDNNRRPAKRSKGSGAGAKRYYVVIEGFERGIIYDTWQGCRHVIDRYPGSVHFSAPTKAVAIKLWRENTDAPVPDVKLRTELTKEDCVGPEHNLPTYYNPSSPKLQPFSWPKAIRVFVSEYSRLSNKLETASLKDDIRGFLTECNALVSPSASKRLDALVRNHITMIDGLKQDHKLEVKRLTDELTTLKMVIYDRLQDSQRY